MNLFARIPFGYKLRLITGLLMGSTARAALTELLRLSRTQSISLWAIAVCGGSLALIALELTSHRTIATIRRLAERAHSITEGNLTGEPVHVDAEDDVGDLARSMDRMQQSIQGVIAAIKETSGTLHDN